MANAVEIVSKAEFATRLNVSKARVSQYVTRGLPVRDDGYLDLSKALAWIEANGQLQSGFPGRGVRRVAEMEPRFTSASKPISAPAPPEIAPKEPRISEDSEIDNRESGSSPTSPTELGFCDFRGV